MQFIKYKFKGNNFGQKIENARKFKDIVSKIQNEQYNFIKNIAMNETIVKWKGEFYLKDYSYKGTLTKYDFLNDPLFINALQYIDRPKIRTIK